MSGMVHLYVGDGKGKTTCAAGLAVRALGCGLRVLFAQFLKGRASGELEPLGRLGADIVRAKAGEKFTFQMTPEELEASRAEHTAVLARIAGMLQNYDLVVLDEVVDAVNASLVPAEDLLALLRGRPDGVEVVLTGREPDARLAGLCDYHTLFSCIGHPYHKGVTARRGIEY